MISIGILTVLNISVFLFCFDNWVIKWKIDCCLVHRYLFDVGRKVMLRIDARVNVSFVCHDIHETPTHTHTHNDIKMTSN